MLEHWLIFAAVLAAAWLLVINLWPRLILYAYKRGLLVKGFGDGPVPVNRLYTQPEALLADPLHATLPPGSSQLMSYGTNLDTLYVVGWLELADGPQRLRVPEMDGRYYSLQFTNPANNTNFAYIGKRTTGTAAGEYLITGPKWRGQTPDGLKQVASPTNSVMLIGRVFVKSESDLPAAHQLAEEIQLGPASEGAAK